MVALDASTLAVKSSWQIPDWQQVGDPDWGNTPILYPDANGRAIVAAANKDGNVQGIAALLFTRYVFAFEVTSALLITAAVGAMILAHVEKRKEDKISQPTMMRRRFAPGSYPGPKPGPGVFATSDSVATPARLPDGTPAERSISPILPIRELTAAEAAPKGTDE